MSSVADQVAVRIERADLDPLDIGDDAFLFAHEIIAKLRTTGFSPDPAEVRGGEFDESDVLRLRHALLAYCENHPEHQTRASAYWALAALHDPCERDLLRKLLTLESSKEFVDENVLWQLMVGLDNIGEDIMKPINDTEDRHRGAGDNWAACRLYVGRHGLP